jgi:hypothetical protein
MLKGLLGGGSGLGKRRSESMKQADQIRKFVFESYVMPARRNGSAEVLIRAGDVHREMGLANAMPAICSAIGSSKFEALSGMRNIARTGPSNGSNALFHFDLSGKSPVKASRIPSPSGTAQERTTGSFDSFNSIILISCVKSKLPHKAAARDLYTSALFTRARGIADQSGCRWYVLSSLYGLLKPQDVVETYDYTLNTIDIGTRRQWAQRVFNALAISEPNLRKVTMFAGTRYREFLVPKLAGIGVDVHVPMEHLRQGEQLAWLADHS